ncbi:MAG: hypothetical protein H6819_03345 [Phycisphaerales bacterium]|nr:hypothetical protein [Phycisphaerales bacterium]MCB9856231.1 hypothetical protein [Phycisphaerales bacterium]MCB9863330.1 hypothetical protein [Phycisphaerales bacterium]
MKNMPEKGPIVDEPTLRATQVDDSRIAVRVEHHNNRIDDHWTSHPGVGVLAWNISLAVAFQVMWLISPRMMITAWLIAGLFAVWQDRREFLDHFSESRTRRGAVLGSAIILVFLAFAIAFAPLYLAFRTSDRVKKNRRQRINEQFDIKDSQFSSRVTCHGEPAELAPLLDIHDAPFEPVIILSRADVFPRDFGSWGMAALLIASFSVITFGLVIGIWFTNRFTGSLAPIAQGVILATLVGIGWPLVRLWRTVCAEYYRIVPGRIDIMKFRPFRTKGRIIDQINVRNARVDVEFNKQQAYIRTTDDPPRQVLLSLANGEPHAFAEAILKAAICSSPAPPLPDDELLG